MNKLILITLVILPMLIIQPLVILPMVNAQHWESTCLNTTHLYERFIAQRCIAGNCTVYILNQSIACAYGCDTVNNVCNPSQTMSWIYFIGGVLGLIFFVAFIMWIIKKAGL